MASSRNKTFIDQPAKAVEVACAGISRFVEIGQHLVVGLSGGIDSVSLLHSLRALTGYRLSALHVHHGLSPNATEWENFCRKLCLQWEIPIVVERVCVMQGTFDGLEAAARRERHAAFGRSPGDFIVLGHHRSDQTETVLFNLLRGTGLAGAAAMQYRHRRLLRPLLDVPRSGIEAYAASQGLEWISDESNMDTHFSRNYLRQVVLPQLVDRFPAGERNVAAAAARFGEALELLNDLAKSDLGDRPQRFPVEVSLLQGLSEPRARNLVRYLLAIAEVRIPAERRFVEAIHQVLFAAPDRHPRVAFGEWSIVRRRGLLDIELSR